MATFELGKMMEDVSAQLAEELARGTQLVASIIRGDLDGEDFVQQYDNFYHYNALDGHEADEEMTRALDGFDNVCEFHRGVQELVDLVFRCTDADGQYRLAGRIAPNELRPRILELAASVGVKSLFTRLEAATSSS